MEAPFDYFFNDRTNPRTIEALKGEPLAVPLEAYARQLHENGYSIQSGALQLRTLGRFNRWLSRRKLRSEDVDTAVTVQFLRGRAPNVRRGDSAALSRLLTILQPNSSNAAPPPTAVEVALEQFQQYLRQERGLTESTVINYAPTVRAFLLERFPEDTVDCQQIAAGEIAAFVAGQAAVITSKRAPLVVT